MSRKEYPTDLTDQEWQLIKPLLPDPKPIGHAISCMPILLCCVIWEQQRS